MNRKRYIGVTASINNVATASANIDAKYGPYVNISEAISNIPISLREVGLTVGIKDGNNVVEYWFNGGIDDIRLIPKSEGSYSPQSASDVFF